MSDCLKNIVTIKPLCGGTVPLSGYDLMAAPEISPQGAAAQANEEYVTGLNMLQAKLDLALLEIQNDFIALLHANGFITSLAPDSYDTGNWNAAIQNTLYNGERGITIYKASAGRTKSLKISWLEIFPVTSQQSAPLYIYDNGLQYTYYFNLTGGQVNRFENLNFVVSGKFARIVMPSGSLKTYAGNITCKLGCDGGKPNPCGYVYGWNGNQDIKTEPFGIRAGFQCECDYTSILCDLARSFTGKLIWLKARILAIDEAMLSTRLNSIVLYGKTQLEKLKPQLEAEYTETWNSMVAALPQLLKSYPSDCITCSGIKIVTNV